MHPLIAAVPVALGFVLAGCDKESADATSDPPRHGTDAGVVSGVRSVDPTLAKAVESVSKARAQSADGAMGPPASGIFAPGRADAELAATAPPKVVVGSAGGTPRVLLASQLARLGKWPASLELRLNAGQGGIPPLKFKLSFETTRAEVPPARTPTPPSAQGTGAATAPAKVVAKVLGVEVSSAALVAPQELQGLLDKLKGSAVRFDVTTGGCARSFETVLASGADPGLVDVLRGIAETLELMLVAMPLEPSGAGGYFMVTSRDHEAASDVVTYRMVRVESVSNDGALLSVTTRRYAVSSRVELPQAAPGQPLELQQYESQGNGRIELDLRLPFPKAAQVAHQLRAALSGPQGGVPSQQLRMESSTQGQLTLQAPGATQ